MGGSETDTKSKAPKPPIAQEPPPPATSSSHSPAVYPNWLGFQAYSSILPHGFFHSPLASSPQAHPYMWGAQHMMPPYGTAPPPYAMYSPGGLFAHPSLPLGSHPFGPYAMPSQFGNTEASAPPPDGAEADGKSSEGKERSPIKRTKGSLGSLSMITGKATNQLGNASGPSANGVYSRSGSSGSEGSSQSDANSQNDLLPKSSGRNDSSDEASQNGTTTYGSRNRLPSQAMSNKNMEMIPLPDSGVPGSVNGPTTNLNIGMDYWGTPPPTIPVIRGSTGAAGAVFSAGIPGSRENMPPELCIKDERELKRQKRKQSNRESARRSRLRKQAECEELAQLVYTMKKENTSLQAEVDRIRKEYNQLVAQNSSLMERIEGTSRGADDTRSGTTMITLKGT